MRLDVLARLDVLQQSPSRARTHGREPTNEVRAPAKGDVVTDVNVRHEPQNRRFATDPRRMRSRDAKVIGALRARVDPSGRVPQTVLTTRAPSASIAASTSSS